MTIKFKLLLNEKRYEPETGYPVVCLISHKQIRREREAFRSQSYDWDENTATFFESHPDYDEFMPKLLSYKIKARKIINSQIESPDKALDLLFDKASTDVVRFNDFIKDYVKEQNGIARNYEQKGDLINRNKILGNTKAYLSAMQSFDIVKPDILISDIDYNALMDFRNYQLNKGNSKSTVHHYLRELRALYNKAIRVHKLHDSKPFTGVFDDLKVKSFQTKKKYITKEDVRKIETYEHYADSTKRFTGLWLLQFYLGGADLIDIYFLKKNQVKKERVYFSRGKTNTGLIIDLKLHPKAKEILNELKCTDPKNEWFFPFNKDKQYYEDFRRRTYKFMQKVQEREGIEVLPMGGNLAGKVARHTFATIAKQLYIDPDLLRELMGHERDDVDNFYKDKFSEKVRDEALFKIIETETI